MTQFKAGDWVTVGDFDFFTPAKKYEVFINTSNELFVVDDDGDEWCEVLSNPKYYGTEKTTPFIPPEEIEAHGRTYKLQHPKGHEWKFPQWARHEEYGIVFIYRVDILGNVFFARRGHAGSTTPEKLTYICNAEIPK